MLKKNLHKKVTNLDLNEIYDTAIQAGAMGGKLLGAGGGGTFYFCKPKLHNKIKNKLYKFQNINFNFNQDGSSNIKYNP